MHCCPVILVGLWEKSGYGNLKIILKVALEWGNSGTWYLTMVDWIMMWCQLGHGFWFVCLWGPTVWCTAGAHWLTGLTGVGHLIAVACWSNSSVEGLQSDVLMLGCALSTLISCWVLWYRGFHWTALRKKISKVSVDSYVSVVSSW